MEPVIAAAYAGLPVVDGDGMGRAFPEVQMTTFFIYGAKAAPAAIADDKGNVVVFKEVIDMFWLERFARDVSVDMGAAAGLAIAPMRDGVRPPHRRARHRHAGAPHRPHRARRPRQAAERRRAGRRVDRRQAVLHRQDHRHAARAGGRLRPRPGAISRCRRLGRLGSAHRHPEREPRALGRRRAGDHGARPDHQPRTRYRRADHHRSAALRPAHRGHRPARPRPDEDAQGAGNRRPAGLRLPRTHLQPAPPQPIVA